MEPTEWNVWGNIKVKEIMEAMKLVAAGEEVDERKLIHEHQHSIWDNYCSRDKIMNWIGGNGFAATITFRKDRLPGDIEEQYLHTKTEYSDKAMVTLFLHPVVATKNT